MQVPYKLKQCWLFSLKFIMPYIFKSALCLPFVMQICKLYISHGLSALIQLSRTGLTGIDVYSKDAHF